MPAMGDMRRYILVVAGIGGALLGKRARSVFESRKPRDPARTTKHGPEQDRGCDLERRYCHRIALLNGTTPESIAATLYPAGAGYKPGS